MPCRYCVCAAARSVPAKLTPSAVPVLLRLVFRMLSLTAPFDALPAPAPRCIGVRAVCPGTNDAFCPSIVPYEGIGPGGRYWPAEAARGAFLDFTFFLVAPALVFAVLPALAGGTCAELRRTLDEPPVPAVLLVAALVFTPVRGVGAGEGVALRVGALCVGTGCGSGAGVYALAVYDCGR